MLIQVEDSGPGFDYSNYKNELPADTQLSGRGIKLLLELCESLTYNQQGNRVEAVYRWVNE